MLMDWSKKNSVTALTLPATGRDPNGQPPPAGAKLADHLLGLLECFAVQLVVRPASFTPIVHDAGVLEHLEVERQPRLRRIEGVLQLADASLATHQQLDYADTGLVRKRVEYLRCACTEVWGLSGHGFNVSIFIDMSRT